MTIDYSDISVAEMQSMIAEEITGTKGNANNLEPGQFLYIYGPVIIKTLLSRVPASSVEPQERTSAR